MSTEEQSVFKGQLFPSLKGKKFARYFLQIDSKTESKKISLVTPQVGIFPVEKVNSSGYLPRFTKPNVRVNISILRDKVNRYHRPKTLLRTTFSSPMNFEHNSWQEHLNGKSVPSSFRIRRIDIFDEKKKKKASSSRNDYCYSNEEVTTFQPKKTKEKSRNKEISERIQNSFSDNLSTEMSMGKRIFRKLSLREKVRKKSTVEEKVLFGLDNYNNKRRDLFKRNQKDVKKFSRVKYSSLNSNSLLEEVSRAAAESSYGPKGKRMGGELKLCKKDLEILGFINTNGNKSLKRKRRRKKKSRKNNSIEVVGQNKNNQAIDTDEEKVKRKLLKQFIIRKRKNSKKKRRNSIERGGITSPQSFHKYMLKKMREEANEYDSTNTGSTKVIENDIPEQKQFRPLKMIGSTYNFVSPYKKQKEYLISNMKKIKMRKLLAEERGKRKLKAELERKAKMNLERLALNNLIDFSDMTDNKSSDEIWAYNG